MTPLNGDIFVTESLILDNFVPFVGLIFLWRSGTCNYKAYIGIIGIAISEPVQIFFDLLTHDSNTTEGLKKIRTDFHFLTSYTNANL